MGKLKGIFLIFYGWVGFLLGYVKGVRFSNGEIVRFKLGFVYIVNFICCI